MTRRTATLVCSFALACAACGGNGATLDDTDSGSENDSAGNPPQPDGPVSSGDDAGFDATINGEDSAAPPGDDSGPGPLDDAEGDVTTMPEDAGHDSGEDASEVFDASKPDASADHDASDHDASEGVDASKPDASDHDASEPDASHEGDSGSDAGVDAGPPPPETLTVTTSGFGVVSSSPSAISCPTSCVTTFPKGTHVALTATPSANQTFKGWSGACSAISSPTCNVTVSTATTVGAEFSETYPTSPTPVPASYACTVDVAPGITEDVTLTLTFAGATPTNVPPGATFSMADFQLVATLPGTFATSVIGDGYTSIAGQGTTLDIVSSTTVNPANPPSSAYAFGPITLVSGDAVVIPLPASAVAIGTWDAISSGTMSFTAGQLGMNLTLTGTSGLLGSPLNVTMSCPAPASTVTISTTTIP